MVIFVNNQSTRVVFADPIKDTANSESAFPKVLWNKTFSGGLNHVLETKGGGMMILGTDEAEGFDQATSYSK